MIVLTCLVPSFVLLGIYSGQYEDDFESSLTQEQTASILRERGKGGSGSEEEGEGEGKKESPGSGPEDGDGIEVSFADISILRESLEADSVIGKSIVSGVK